MNKKVPISSKWPYVGPLLLLISLFLLFGRALPLLAYPVWFMGLGFALLISLAICFLTLRELVSYQQQGVKKSKEQEEKIAAAFATLNEAEEIFRAKVIKLEAALSTLENEREGVSEELESVLDGLRKSKRALQGEVEESEKRAFTFRNSLECALDELRSARKLEYLLTESGKRLPKDLPQKHKQLREQFEEKSMILEQTRNRLFTVEGELLALKKSLSAERLDLDKEQEILIQEIDTLLEEKGGLEEEISALHELIGGAIAPKKTTRSKKSEKVEQILELQF